MPMLKEHGKKRQINELHDKRDHKRQQSENEQISLPTDLQKCQICNRYFIQNRLIDHQRVCGRSKKLHSDSKDPYHYDSQLHRWKGLNYRHSTSQSNVKRSRSRPLSKHIPKTHWKEKHQQFQDAMKGQYHPTHDLIQSIDNRPYQCSHCRRKFATEHAIIKHQKGCTNDRLITSKRRNIKNKSVKY